MAPGRVPLSRHQQSRYAPGQLRAPVRTRRRSPLSGCLAALLVGAGVLFLGLVAVALFIGSAVSSMPSSQQPFPDSAPFPETQPFPAPGPGYGPGGSGGSEPGGPAPGEPDPAPGAGGRSTTSAPAPELNPGPVPEPRTDPELFALLEENPVYAQSLPSTVDCGVQAQSVANMSAPEMEMYLNDVTACLGMVWDGSLEGAGWETHRPPVTVYGGSSGMSACGQLPSGNAVYCAADQELYVASDLPQYLPELEEPLGMDLVLAHEYGHFVQGRTGIIVSSHMLQSYYGVDSAQGQDASRRAELQADCFSGLYLGRVHEAQGVSGDAHLPEIFSTFGDDYYGGGVTGHGSAEARARWGQDGLDSTSIGTCNTWVADEDEVY